jgi:fructokinase
MKPASPPLILGVGELLWDLLPSGKKVGGAVANLIYFARSLGTDAYLASSVGDDELGRELAETMADIGFATRFMQTDTAHPTGTVDVEVAPDGKPTFTINEDVAWDFIAASPDLLAAAGRADAVCFGSLCQRADVSRKTIRQAVNAAPPDAVRMCDINLRQHFFTEEIIRWSFDAAHVVKLNDEELPVVCGLLGIEGDADESMRLLIREFDLQVLALTRGDQGSVLLTSEDRSEHHGFEVKVRDSVGAGDAFAATLLLGVLNGADIHTINAHANRVASYVCSQYGGTPPVPEVLRAPA